MNIVDFIPHGMKNAVTGKELRRITGLDERTVKQQIANARLKGSVICSILDGNRGGYFIPESPEEAVEYGQGYCSSFRYSEHCRRLRRP